MNVLVMPVGSAGDHHPLIGLGVALRKRGHRVRVFTNGHFQAVVEKAGLEYVEIGDEAVYLEALRNPELWHPTHGFRAVMGHPMIPVMVRRQYDAIAAEIVHGPATVIAGSLALGARIAREKLQFPLVTVHLQPIVLRSYVDPPVGSNGMTLRWLPRWGIRSIFWLADKFMMDPVIRPAIEPLRRELGLPAVKRYLKDWINSPDLVLGLFPSWYMQAPDWPVDVRLVGFPLFDERTEQPLPAAVREFLDAGPPPVAATFGSAMQMAQAPFAAVVDACRRLGRRAILLTPYRDQLPSPLPSGVVHFDYVPLSQFLPETAALIHHGGIGTCAQGLAAGVPQLVMPLSHDQPDNAYRLERLGVGRTIFPTKFTGARVAKALGEMLADARMAGSCKATAGRFVGTDPAGDACKWIEEIAKARSGAP